MIFVSSETVRTGGIVRNPVGWTDLDDLDQIREWEENLKDAGVKAKLILRDSPTYKKKGRDCLLIPNDYLDEFLNLQYVAIVNEDYYRLLTVFQKENRVIKQELGLYEGQEDDITTHFWREKRGKLISLLKNGSYEENPESAVVQIANSLIEKIDLGRRTDLKLSSNQSEKLFQSDAYVGAGLAKHDEGIREAIQAAKSVTDERLSEFKACESPEDQAKFFQRYPWLMPTYKDLGIY